MNTDVEIYIYDDTVNCDRYHLLMITESNPTLLNQCVYSESGNSFNGFNNPFILNVNYDRIKCSRICAIKLRGMNCNLQNEEQPIYCLINSIEPLRNDKTVIEIEPDAWMNYRYTVKIGNINKLFQTTKYLEDYPFKQHEAKYKTMVTSDNYELFKEQTRTFNILVLRHREAKTAGQGEIGNPDEDWIYYFKTSDSYFEAIHSLFLYFYNENIDTNQIIAMFLSPFELKIGTG